MIVKNNQPSHHRIALPSTGAIHTPARFIDLMPGNNVVAEKDWIEAKDHPLVKHRLQERHYEVDLTTPGDTHKIADEQGAVRMVEDTLDRKLLQRWRESEQRVSVVAAIDKQLERVKPDVKKDEKKDGK